jgi:hypothetical protein
MAHISPAHSENINFFGAIEVDIEGELALLGPTGYRPLRPGGATNALPVFPVGAQLSGR